MLPRSRGGLDALRYGLHLLDVPVLYAAFVVAYALRFSDAGVQALSGWIPDAGAAPPPLAEYHGTFLLMACGWSLFLWGSGFYERVRFDLEQAFRLGGQLVIAGGFSLAVFFFRRDFSYSRVVILLGFNLAYLVLAGFHLLKSRLLLGLMRRGFGRAPAAVVGPAHLALPCLARFSSQDDLGLEVLGYLGDPLDPDAAALSREGIGLAPAPAGAGPVMARSYLLGGAPGARAGEDLGELAARYPRLGGIGDIPGVVEREGIQELFVAHPITDGERLLGVVRTCENTSAAVRVVPDVMSIIARGVRMRLVAGVPVLDVGRSPMAGLEGILKRGLDLLGSFLGLLALSPLFLYLAVRVKRDSPGPIFYRQERVGMDGRPFQIFKFRSMPVDAEASTGPIWATRADPRATPWGAFMRKWSLDELPQLWNVLRGDMSLVGPRPERPHFVNRFRQDIQGYMQRHRVKAGITGWAQINGLRGECPIEERTRYDVWYIENWSLLLDLEILIRTLWIVLFRPEGG